MEIKYIFSQMWQDVYIVDGYKAPRRKSHAKVKSAGIF